MAESSQASTMTTIKAERPGPADQADGTTPPSYEGEKEKKAQPGVPALGYDEGMDLADEQELGAIRMEAVYLVFGKGWKLWTLWASIGVIAFVYALSQSTTYTYLAFATSAFGTHTITATIGVITAIMAGVIKPFIAKLSDLTSRPLAIAISVALYAIGYSMTAGAKNVDTVAAGEVIYTVGNTGIDFVLGIIQADITPLQWRGFVSGMTSLPFVPNAFIAGYITSGISAFSQNGWRWGYGMFAIMVPVCIAPALLILFWADRRAKRLGALSLASSSYARRQQIGTEQKRSVKSLILHWLNIIDAIGLILVGFTFALLLSPSTLKATAKGGYKNPSLIAMYCVGGVLFLVFLLWEFRFAKHPIMPKRILNRTVICSIGIDFMYYLSGYITSTYLLSWVFVTKGYSDKDYTYFSNILTVGLCFFGVVVGVIQRITHRYKYLQVFGLGVRCIGVGLIYNATVGNHSDVNIVMAQVLISLGGACSVIGSQVATQASVPHRDMAMALALLSLWTSIGGSIGSAISAEIWNTKLPRYLKEYLGDTHTDAELAEIFGSIVVAAAAEPREQIIIAYDKVMRDLALPSLCLCFTELIFGLCTSNFYLGKTHNAIEGREVTFREKDETTDEALRQKVEDAEAKARLQLGSQRDAQDV